MDARGIDCNTRPNQASSTAGSRSWTHRGITRTAEYLSGLDLVITIDSLPAHLAGALGVPVWTLLSTPADWRWLTERSDSPWYPTMRLFRQSDPGKWGPVVEDVRRALVQRFDLRT